MTMIPQPLTAAPDTEFMNHGTSRPQAIAMIGGTPGSPSVRG